MTLPRPATLRNWCGTGIIALCAACSDATLPADTIYLNGDILTVDDARPVVEAVAVRDGLIVAVGNETDVLELHGESTVIRDLGGRTMAPGFIDGHAHFGGFGAQAVGANLLAAPDGNANTIDDFVREM